MVYVEIGVAFVTTFLGVFLAFGLENYRQRRRTTAWVRRHLAHLRGVLSGELTTTDAVDQVLQRQVDACTAWMAAQEDLNVEQWELIGTVINARGPDFGAILRSEAISVLPADLALALAQTEYGASVLEHVLRSAQRAQDDLLPLVYDRTVPLSAADRRRVERFREALSAVAAQAHEVRMPLAAVVSATDAWLA